MSEEVSLKEILGDVAKSTSKKEDDGSFSVSEIKELIKMFMELRKLQMPEAPKTPPNSTGKSPEERANIIWGYLQTVIGQLAEMYPDMTIKEIREKLPQFEGVVKPALLKLAKSL